MLLFTYNSFILPYLFQETVYSMIISTETYLFLTGFGFNELRKDYDQEVT